jgi:hypothetical protein
MLIGIDFDNTISNYDGVFSFAARHMGLLDAAADLSKLDIRARLRALPDGEVLWQRLQGRVYGHYMGAAKPFPGFVDFVARARGRGAELAVISHRTRHGHFDPDHIDLHAAARDWLRANGFFDRLGFAEADIQFHLERDHKVAAIAALGCTHFIDDLDEVLHHPDFPATTAGYLFGPAGYRSWADLAAAILP